MKKETYIQMTERTRAIVQKLPGKERILRVPTLLCALCYLLSLLALFLRHDARLLRAVLVPACCFLLATFIRPLIGRTRPYDRFGVPPVGSYRPGKGKSMPSRHTACAAAIACAVVYAFPSWPTAVMMGLLAALIAALRVLSGQHYPSDVFAALALSLAISAAGYLIG